MCAGLHHVHVHEYITLLLPEVLVITCLNTSLVPSPHSTAIVACSQTASVAAMAWLCQLCEGQYVSLFSLVSDMSIIGLYFYFL